MARIDARSACQEDRDFMDKNSADPPCYIVAGHHRSGTSVIASILQSAGLDIGQNLLGPDHGNVRGHFEDVDFLEFHRRALTSQGLDVNGYVRQPRLAVPQQYREEARGLVQARMK